jgi:hypothetical protein
MPTFQGLVSEEQVNALVAYVKSLSSSGQTGGASANPATVVPAQSPAKPPSKGNQVQ